MDRKFDKNMKLVFWNKKIDALGLGPEEADRAEALESVSFRVLVLARFVPR